MASGSDCPWSARARHNVQTLHAIFSPCDVHSVSGYFKKMSMHFIDIVTFKSELFKTVALAWITWNGKWLNTFIWHSSWGLLISKPKEEAYLFMRRRQMYHLTDRFTEIASVITAFNANLQAFEEPFLDVADALFLEYFERTFWRIRP